MDSTRVKTLIKDFVAQRKRLVLATVDPNGWPEAAFVAYGDTPDGRIVIGTSNQSRKYANIRNRSYAAAVVGLEGSESVQLEGDIRILDPEEYDRYIDYHFNKNPDAERYRHQSDQAYLLFTPQWARYVDVATEPETRHEATYDWPE